ncbi:glycosyltransferase [Pseudochrobactrum asaccharolyticum]|uniref:glycosyltransferase n=1 Tax=Pseudochrobactrum asaccharolyticum TaxID=354351 RepID=UPI00404233FF
MQNDKPKISVILTSFNVDAFISDALDCAVNQTLKDIEIIVVDDGSTDGTQKIIEEYARRDSRIKPILQKENSIGGVATPANLGMDAARGEYIGFIDGDDLLKLDAFEKLYLSAKSFDSDICVCQFNEFFQDSPYSTSEPLGHNWSQLPKEDHFISTVIDKKALLSLSPVPWRKIYKREMIEKNNIRFPVVDHFFEDNPFHWQTVLSAEKVSLVREVLFHHRMKRSGQTVGGGHLVFSNVFNFIPYFIKYSKSDHEAEYQSSIVKWILDHARYYLMICGKTQRRKNIELIKHSVKRIDEKWYKNAFTSGEIGLDDVELLGSILRGSSHSARRNIKRKNNNIFSYFLSLRKILGLKYAFKFTDRKFKPFRTLNKRSVWIKDEINSSVYKSTSVNSHLLKIDAIFKAFETSKNT